MSQTALEAVAIRTVEQLTLRPGDLLVITMPDASTQNHRQAVSRSMQALIDRVIGPNVAKVLCLPASMSLQLVRGDKQQPAGPGFEHHDAKPEPPSLEMGVQKVGLLGVLPG